MSTSKWRVTARRRPNPRVNDKLRKLKNRDYIVGDREGIVHVDCSSKWTEPKIWTQKRTATIMAEIEKSDEERAQLVLEQFAVSRRKSTRRTIIVPVLFIFNLGFSAPFHRGEFRGTGMSTRSEKYVLFLYFCMYLLMIFLAHLHTCVVA